MTTESYLTDIPENISLLQSTKFTFVIPEMPFAKYFCQRVNLPGVSTSPAAFETPFSKVNLHGDKLVYEPLNISFLIDEDLRVWEETYEWLKSLTFPHDFDEYKRRNLKKVDENYYDGILTVNNNANLENLRITYHHVHPIALSGIDFNTMIDANEIITATVTFSYDTFSIERL